MKPPVENKNAGIFGLLCLAHTDRWVNGLIKIVGDKIIEIIEVWKCCSYL